MSAGLWRDDDFKLRYLAFVVKDRKFLREVGRLVDADDWKPRKSSDPQEMWRLATLALDWWEKYREPIGKLLRAEAMEFARKMKLSEKERKRLLDTARRIRKEKLVAAESITDKVIAYKKERMKAETIDKLISLQEANELTDDKWVELCSEAIYQFKANLPTSEFFEELDKRIDQRRMDRSRIWPKLFLPLDDRIRIISRGHLGLWMAYLGVGKSMALIHTALAYVWQGLNVLYFTLEDPLDQVQDRIDANIAMLPSRRLDELPNKLRKRFSRFKKYVRGRLKIVDGCDEEVTVGMIGDTYDHYRNQGFTADAIIIDYDDEIKPVKKRDARRFEYADIYRDLRRLASQKNVIIWTASQTGRDTAEKPQVGTHNVAEDISKSRKVSIAIGIGEDADWGKEGKLLNVDKHKFDLKKIKVWIVSKSASGTFYDPVATARMAAEVERLKLLEEKGHEVGEGIEI